VLAIAAVCFLPWVYVPVANITVTGFNANGTDFGKPGLLLVILGGINVIFFLTPKIWAKRTNVFIGAVTLAWAIKNYIIISSCYEGDCPVKKIGIYLQLLFAIIVLLMTFFPKIKLPVEKA
jgi:hypothetical protein